MINALIFTFITFIPFAYTKQINGNYFNTKMFLIYMLGSICLSQIVFLSSSLRKINFSKPLWSALIFLLIYQIFGQIFNHPLTVLYSFKAISLCAMTYYFYNLKFSSTENREKQFSMWLSLIIFGLLGLHLYEIYQYRIVQNTIDHSRLLGTFGNVNMVSEFFILSVPFVFYWSQMKVTSSKIFKSLALVLWIFIILYSRSRSSWLGLLLFSIYILYSEFSKKNIFIFLAGFLLYQATVLLPSTNLDPANDVKKNSFIERLSLYKATVHFIADHPAGIGLGRFTNEIIPYRMFQEHRPHEFEYADQPHSEILKWGVQYGWLGLLVCLGLLGYIILSLFKIKDHLLICGFLVLLPQILFQFPFENPASILLISIYLGLWLRKTNPLQLFTIDWKIKAPLVLIVLLMFANGASFISSIYVESQLNKDLEKTSLMCSIYPINHKNCNYKNVLLLEANQTSEFRQDLKSELIYSYFTSDQQRILPLYFQKINDVKHMCENILIYKLLYPLQRNYSTDDLRFCQKFQTPIKFDNPLEVSSDYQAWLQKALFE